MKKIRLDVYLTDHGLTDSRSLAQRLIMAGEVEVNGQVYLKPSQKIDPEAAVLLKTGPKFVSRGGEKLEPALLAFHRTDLSGKICVDVGASTGGFTDCLLQYGAEHVFAIDVGHGILHWKLRTDERVTVMERTNARFVEGFKRAIDLVTIDASFISLKTLLPVIKTWLEPGGEVIALIKPQFEAGKKDAAKGSGVIRNSEIHRKVLLDVLQYVQDIGFTLQAVRQSALKGPKGNIEFLVHLVRSEEQGKLRDVVAVVDELIPLENEADQTKNE